VVELRTRIDALRTIHGLSGYTWSDSALTADTTSVRQVHVAELREALRQAYVSANVSPPMYSDLDLTTGFTIRAVHLAQLRSAVVDLETFR
jgi:hypothetical protein